MSNNINFNPHDIEWTPDKIGNFWWYIGQNKSYESTFFSGTTRESIISLTRKIIDIRGEVLDFGCGSGFLLEALVNHNISSWGLDFSNKCVERTRERLKDHPLFKGAVAAHELPTSLPDASFQVVFLIETIEHLLPEQMGATLSEIRRLLIPGGYLVVTTPNLEPVELRKIICPDCGCVFHPMQHIHTFNKNTLASTLEDYGFQKVFGTETRLDAAGFIETLRNIWLKIKKIKFPHLLVIAKKVN